MSMVYESRQGNNEYRVYEWSISPSVLIISAKMNPNSQLLSLIQGCLNSSTINSAERGLVEYSRKPTFIEELLQLVPNQPPQVLIMIISTLKNFVQERYENPFQSPIPQDQKALLANNLFNLFYEIYQVPQAVNLYKEIVHTVVSADFEDCAGTFYKLLKEDLDGSIMASTYFVAQVARHYQYLTFVKRAPFEEFIANIFPQLEILMERILSNYTEQTRVLLNELLNMFYCAVHLEIPFYLRNFDNLSKWLMYFHTTLKAPLDNYPNNHIVVSRIYVKLFSMFCRSGTDGKAYRGWSVQFCSRYASDLYNTVVEQLINPLPEEDFVANMVRCLSCVVDNVDLNPLLQESHCEAIIYKHLLPYMHSTNEENSYFQSDGLEYIRRQQDLTCYPFRTAGIQLIKNIANKLNYGQKSELIKFVEHSANVLGSSAPPSEKEVVLVVLTEMNHLVMKNKYLRENFQNLIKQYLIPIMRTNNDILVAQTIRMLEKYLELATISTPTVRELLALLYEKMTGECLVVKFQSMVAFTKLLKDEEALDQTRPHFQAILEIYVKVLDTIQHEKLLASLETVVRCFSGEIGMFAKDLSSHLFTMFHSYYNKQEEGEDDLGDNSQAQAALSTIKQILNSPLSPESYYNISQNVIILLQRLPDYDSYFSQIIDLLNTLVYRSGNIADYQFPYLLCYKLLEGNNGILGNCQNPQNVRIIAETEQADGQYAEALISILKNLIQKMPEGILHRYPYPTNPELLLCLIQNKKLPMEVLSNLQIQNIDQQWSLILQSYTALIYGVGQLCDISQLKMLNGVSVYPWLENRFDLAVVKRVLYMMEEEDGDDDYYEENTMQMLEQMAAEDDEDDEDEYYVSDGGNYGYNYDSPFDSSKDRIHLVSKLKQLNNSDLNCIFSQVKPKYRTKLETLLSNSQ